MLATNIFLLTFLSSQLHSEYKSTYRWHEFSGPEVVRKPPVPNQFGKLIRINVQYTYFSVFLKLRSKTFKKVKYFGFENFLWWHFNMTILILMINMQPAPRIISFPSPRKMKNRSKVHEPHSHSYKNNIFSLTALQNFKVMLVYAWN